MAEPCPPATRPADPTRRPDPTRGHPTRRPPDPPHPPHHTTRRATRTRRQALRSALRYSRTARCSPWRTATVSASNLALRIMISERYSRGTASNVSRPSRSASSGSSASSRHRARPRLISDRSRISSGAYRSSDARERLFRALVIAEHDQGVPLVEQQLALRVPERGVAPLGGREPAERLMRGRQQGPHPAQGRAGAGVLAPRRRPGQGPGLQHRCHHPGHAGIRPARPAPARAIALASAGSP